MTTFESILTARKLDPETADRMGVRFHEGNLRFEYLNHGNLQFCKVRAPGKKFWIEPSGAQLQFWNIDAVRSLLSRPSEPLVICEGELDAVAIFQSCGGYVLSVPNGSSGRRTMPGTLVSQDTSYAYLWDEERLIPEIDQFDKVILATDGDKPGVILRDELALRIGERRCWYVTYPAECKDANDVLIKHGEDGVRQLIAGARPLRPGHLVRPDDLPPRPREIPHSTGWDFLDKHLMLVRPELLVATGFPGHGKGQFLRVLALHLAESHGWRTAIFAPEDPPHRIKRDLRRFALRKIKFPNQNDQSKAFEWVNDHFLLSLPPEDDGVTLDVIEHEMYVAAVHHSCQVFIIDPWNEIDHRMERGMSIDLYIEYALRRLKRKARQLGLLLVIAAHPIKIEGEPTLMSINGSANWRNKADHGIILYRSDVNSNRVKLTTEKSKDWETMGIPGSVEIEFNRNECDYHQIISKEST